MSTASTTTNPVWDDMMDCVSWGQTPASVPVMFNGEPALYTSATKMPDPVDELDAIAHAYVACRQAYREAERAGAHALD